MLFHARGPAPPLGYPGARSWGGPGHPFALALQDLRRARARVSEIALEPLGLPHATQFVADALGCDKAAVVPLAALAFDKTGGNPLFLGQFLRGLGAEGLLHFQMDVGAWTWDLEGIRATAATENVVDFMARKARRLRPEALQRGGVHITVPYYYTAKLTLAVLHEDYAGAMAAAELAEEHLGASAGIYFTNEIPFYGGLAAAALLLTAEGEAKERHAARLAAWQAKTAVLAEL